HGEITHHARPRGDAGTVGTAPAARAGFYVCRAASGMKIMNCRLVQKSLSAYIDLQLTGAERSSVSRHLGECAACGTRSEQIRRMRVALRSIPNLAVPERLVVDLRVLASRERALRASRLNLSAFINYWSQKLGLVVDNLMRPLALPFAGGLTSAVLLF